MHLCYLLLHDDTLRLLPLNTGNDATGHVFVDIVSHWMDANHEEATLNSNGDKGMHA